MASNVKTGDVLLEDFDRGVVETLGAVVNAEGSIYVIKNISGVDAPPGFEGVPVYFAFADDTLDPKILPSFVIRRDEIIPALSRWHLGLTEYKVPAVGSSEVTITNPITEETMATKFDAYEYKDQAVPFDLVYTIQIRARYRNNLRVEAMKMLSYAMRKYQPYTTVTIEDSLGDKRTYDTFMERPAPLDTKEDVAGRINGFNLTLRVEAELDLNDPVVVRSITSLPQLNFTKLTS